MSHKDLGFSLLECSISMSLGLMLITIGLYAYQLLKREVIFSNQQVERFIASLEIQQFLKNDLRLSGYYGNRTIFGCDGRYQSCVHHLPARSRERIKPNTQILIVYHIRSSQSRLSQSMQRTTDPLKIEGPGKIRAGSQVLIQDGSHRDFFIVSAAPLPYVFHDKTPFANQQSSLSQLYAIGSEVIELKTVAYYLGIPPRFVGSHLKVFSLYRDDLYQNAEEIIAGIVDLAFEYQVKDDIGRSSFQQARSLLDSQWSKVCGLRLKVQFEGGQTAVYAFSVPNRFRARGGVDAYHIDQPLIDLFD